MNTFEIKTVERNAKIGDRLLITIKPARIQRNEWTLLELAPNEKMGKFRNELCKDTIFWKDLYDVEILDVLK